MSIVFEHCKMDLFRTAAPLGPQGGIEFVHRELNPARRAQLEIAIIN
jgi:hypothetical protein